MEYQKQLDHYRSNKKSYHKSLDRLKRVPGKTLDERFAEQHEEVFEIIDCLKCANCCKTISPIFKQKDIERIAKSVNLKPQEFIRQYLNLDHEGDYVLKQTPCPFLGVDNYCSIYNVRPKACREFPHTDHRNMHKHLGLTKKNLAVCPAVVHIVRGIDSAIDV